MAKTHETSAPAIAGFDREEDEWRDEIREAKEARNRAKSLTASNPRAEPSRGQMQRRPLRGLIRSRLLSTQPNTPTDTTVKS